MKILIADDDATLRTTLADLLEADGHEVQTAVDGKEAFARLEAEPFDLAFLDWAMPEATGLEVLRRAKSLRPQTAFFMMTGYGNVGAAVDAMKLGAKDYVQKPFDVEAIERAVQDVEDGLTRPPSPSAAPRASRVGLRARRRGGPIRLPDVKAAFLHYGSGILVASNVRAGEKTVDEDLLVATLHSIQTFMRTSFPMWEGKQLSSISQGPYTLLLEKGRRVYLTVVIRGEETPYLRQHMRSILRQFERENRKILRDWNGDPSEIRGADLLLSSLVAESSWSPESKT